MLLQRRKPWPIILSSLGFAWAGCSPAAPRADPPLSQEAAATRPESAAVAPRESPSIIEPDERAADLATAVSVLSARLLPALTEREQNVALSALGLHMALAQLATACRGATCEKFAEVLSRPIDASFSSEYVSEQSAFPGANPQAPRLRVLTFSSTALVMIAQRTPNGSLGPASFGVERASVIPPKGRRRDKCHRPQRCIQARRGRLALRSLPRARTKRPLCVPRS